MSRAEGENGVVPPEYLERTSITGKELIEGVTDYIAAELHISISKLYNPEVNPDKETEIIKTVNNAIVAGLHEFQKVMNTSVLQEIYATEFDAPEGQALFVDPVDPSSPIYQEYDKDQPVPFIPSPVDNNPFN